MKLERVYLLTMIFLILHQIDAAYWKEWEMFNLPGGIQVYLVFNMLAIPIVLIGYKSLISQTADAKYYSYICAGLGVLTSLIHACFALFGSKQFNLPLSIAILVLCLVFGLYQMVLTKRQFI